MTEPRWLSPVVVLAIHSAQIRHHGGSLGLRDRALLESALDRPRNRFHYEPGSDLFTLAAAYGLGIAKNYPFIDGKKRVAFQAMYLFLGLNGFRIEAPEEEIVTLILDLAKGELHEQALTTRLLSHSVPR